MLWPSGILAIKKVDEISGAQPTAPETTKQSLIVSAKQTAQHFYNSSQSTIYSLQTARNSIKMMIY